MKKLLAVAMLLSLVSCAPAETRFMPEYVGISGEPNRISAVFSGMSPTGNEDEPEEYIVHKENYTVAPSALSNDDVDLSLLFCVAVDTELSDNGLYEYYSPVFYNASASEGTMLILSDDVEELLSETAQDNARLRDFLSDSDIRVPGILAFDIASRTPGMPSALPIVNCHDNDLTVDGAAVFVRGKPVYRVAREDLSMYSLLCSGVSCLAVFELQDGESGVVDIELSRRVQCDLDGDRIRYSVMLYGIGLVSGRSHRHEDTMLPGDAYLIEEAIEHDITTSCAEFADRAFRESGFDIFGFSEYALAKSRKEYEDVIDGYSCDLIDIDISCDISIRNLSQIH